jgi:hypothetical protein
VPPAPQPDAAEGRRPASAGDDARSTETGQPTADGDGRAAGDAAPPTPDVRAVDACAGQLCGGTCVDLQTDARNCGRCGHDCLVGACYAGSCQPFGFHKVPGEKVMALAAMDRGIVWANLAGQVQRCFRPDCQGAPDVLLDHPGKLLGDLVVDRATGDIVVLESGSAPGVTIVGVTTAGKVTFSIPQSRTEGTLALDAQYVYWVSENQFQRARRLDGSDVQTLPFRSSSHVATVVHDEWGHRLFITSQEYTIDAPRYKIETCTLPDCADAQLVTTGQGYASKPAVSGSRLFWGTDADSQTPRIRLYSCPLIGPYGQPIEEVVGEQMGTAFITGDGDAVYFSVGKYPSAALLRCPSGGCQGKPVTVVDGWPVTPPGGVNSFDNDAATIYWIDGGRQIVALVK